MKYIGIDGDNIGDRLEFFLLESQEESIRSFSQEVELHLKKIWHALQQINAQMILCSGDSLLCKVEVIDAVLLRKAITSERTSGITFSAGIGETLKDAYIALKYAKASGKNKIIYLENGRYILI